MPAVPSMKLDSGNSIPVIGIGTAAFGAEAVAHAKIWLAGALKNGYRHIDTAYLYDTEKVIGEVIKESGIPREQLFVTTKAAWNTNDQNTIEKTFEESLQKLGLDYVDLYLLHWPQTVSYEETTIFPLDADGVLRTIDKPTFNETYAEMEKLLSTGKVKAIGVSNFSIKTMHPYLAQNDLRDYCAKRGITLTAYTPSGHSKVRTDPLIVELAAKYKVNPTQVILAWHIARDIIIIPKSADESRQRENINLPSLDKEDVKKISGLDRGERIWNKTDDHGKINGWTLEQLGW